MARTGPASAATSIALVPIALALAVPLSGQEPPLRYPAQATAIVVDVVVDDAHGQPVRGLTKDDFTLLEDGKPQPIVGFEVHDVRAETEAAAEAAEATAAVATNTGRLAQPGRVLALLIDDLGISAPVAGQLKPALAAWIAGHAQPRDEITIMTTSGSVWWSDIVESGREDLLTVLGRVQGKLLAEGNEEMSEAEAYRIDVLEQSTEFAVGNDSRSRPTDGVGSPGGAVKFVGNSVTERVVQRWLDTHVCPPCVSPYESPIDCREIRQCFQRVRMRATEIHTGAARRTAAVLGAISRLSRGLATARGRKSILVVSEALVHDASLGAPFRDAIDAAQRANTSLYFVDARGLAGASFQEAAASSQPPRGQDVGAMSAEASVVATGGGESLADETGGRLTRSNDIAAGLERMADDSSVYYLLGYQPEKPPDGGWHKLEVKVARPGVQVRARRGYRALRPQDLERAAKQQVETARTSKEPKAARVGKRPLAPTLLAGSARGSLALRLSTYVGGTNGAGAARVQVALEIDNSQVQIDRSLTPWTASLDLSILAAGLFHPPIVPVDERLDLTLRPSDVGNGWWLVSRDVWLQPGVSQVRALVKDVASGRVGLVAQRIDVPDVDHPYLSTPLLSDRTLPPAQPGEPPRLVPTARRAFEPKGTLYCQYEVFNYGGLALAGVPQLFGGYTLERSSGTVVSEETATRIDTADGRHAVRRIALPLEKLSPGPYFLALLIQDRLSGRVLTSRAGFEVLSKEAVPTAP
jgi:VWFA-related protein